MIRTQMMMIEYAVEGGSIRLEWEPGGAFMAGVRYWSEVRDVMMT